jgi:hypothetical protein
MTTVSVLESLKEFIKEITDDFKFEKAGTTGDADLVPPVVCVGWLPPKNYLPEGYDVPCVIVGMDNGEEDDQESKLSVKLTFATYGAGETDEEGNFIPDMNGYIDLLNLMEVVKRELVKSTIIKGKTRIYKPIKWGMYEEQMWPLWHGYMTFDASFIAGKTDMRNSLSFLDADDAAHIKIPT